MITDEQYESLFAFCRKHYVRYYDVQVELADHLSAAIEERMSNNPKLSFEQALDAVYAGFGIKGFADIVATREKMMSKQCRKQKWKLFFTYFTVPKVAMTVCLYAVLLLLGSLFTHDYFRMAILFTIGLGLFIFEIIHSIKASKLFKHQIKAMLYTSERLTGLVSLSVLLQIFFSTRVYKTLELRQINFLDYSIISFIMLVTFIAILAHRDFIKELYNTATELYPKAFS